MDCNCISLQFLPTFPNQLKLMDMLHILVPACTKQLFVWMCCASLSFVLLGISRDRDMNLFAMKEATIMDILECMINNTRDNIRFGNTGVILVDTDLITTQHKPQQQMETIQFSSKHTNIIYSSKRAPLQ